MRYTPNLDIETRVQQVIDALADGAATLQEIADRMGVTRQRVEQIIDQHLGTRRGWARRTLAANRTQRDGIDAFGERKTIRKWEADPRCVVNAERLAARLEHGWTAEEAITTPLGQRAKPRVEINPEELARLRELIALARTVRFTMPADDPARLAAHERDRLVRTILNQGITVQRIADAAGVSKGSVQTWLSYSSGWRDRTRYARATANGTPRKTRK